MGRRGNESTYSKRETEILFLPSFLFSSTCLRRTDESINQKPPLNYYLIKRLRRNKSASLRSISRREIEFHMDVGREARRLLLTVEQSRALSLIHILPGMRENAM